VTRYIIDVHEVTHTCPADPNPHPFDIRRTVVEVVPGGPCRNPTTVHTRSGPLALSCSRARPWYQHCDACRVTVTVRNTTRHHTGPYRPPSESYPSGYAPDPCVVCGQPLAAVLAASGRHLLCVPVPDPYAPAPRSRGRRR
jgi:hypothetical protein